MICLERIEQDIRDAYQKIGYDQSWTFLGSNKTSFHKDQKLLFVGLNPGGERIEPTPINFPYQETLYCYDHNDKDRDYNTYLDATDWTNTGDKNPLQLQVIDLYKKLYKKIGAINPQTLAIHGSNTEGFMRKSLVLNYTPFRSSSWKVLKNKDDALDFSKNLWEKHILREISPSTIITMNRIAYEEIKNIFSDNGYTSEPEQTLKTGWGKAITYDLIKFAKAGSQSVSIARCPHLSRYKLFNNDTYVEFQENFISFLANSLCRH